MHGDTPSYCTMHREKAEPSVACFIDMPTQFNWDTEA